LKLLFFQFALLVRDRPLPHFAGPSRYAQRQQTLTTQARGFRQAIIGGILTYHDGTPDLGML